MNEIVLYLTPLVRWLAMKKDKELPWVTRIARWALMILGVVWATGYVLHDLIVWFG
jgi:hypothetical protein